jgi:hypothetical protein
MNFSKILVNFRKLNLEGNVCLKSLHKTDFNLNNVTNLFTSEIKSKLCLLEGFSDLNLDFLGLEDPSHIPGDILVFSFVKDGEFKKEEVSRNFDLWQNMQNTYIKMYQSPKLMGSEGSSWFFVVFKKRMLVTNIDKIELKNENPLFDSRVFYNMF